MIVSRRGITGAASALTLILAGCSGAASPSPSAAPSAPPAASASAEASGAAASGSAQAYEIDVASGAVGQFLTGEDGKTLYVFKQDTSGSGKSVCNGSCATKWPPFELEASETATAGSGVDASQISTITRDDGSKQVAYKGQPLYYYASDTKAGDTNGQGVGNVWFVAQP